MKRRRSRKNRNTYFKRKNNYKFNFMSNIEGRKNVQNYRDSFKSKLPNDNPYNGHLTSNWFWSNYRIAHNFWKMKAPADDWTGLLRDHPEVEKLIRKYLPNTYYFVSGNWKNNPYGNQSNYNRTAEHADSLLRVNSELNSTNSYDIDDDDDDDENNDDCEAEEEDANDDIEYEMSEEMIEFFKVSFRHKMSLKKEKEEKEQALDLEAKVIEFQANKLKRASEMKLLYGEEASKIIGMETALQLSFDKYCDTKVPQYWPNIPLNL